MKTFTFPRISPRGATACVVALLPAFAPSAHAQLLAAGMERVIVTATRTAQPLDQTLAQATILTRDDIDRAGFASLAELLQREAGLEMRATGGPGQPASIFLRGSNRTHTLVLVDGLRVNSSTDGGTALEHLPLAIIERIEIVKGPMSGLYGSDAIGGVVQIFTRQSDKPRLSLNAGFGSDSRAALGAGFSVQEGRTALTMNVGFDDVRAPSATNLRAFAYNPDRDPYRNTNALVKLSHTLWQGEVVSFSAWQSRGKTDFDSGPSPASNKQTLSGYSISSENNLGRHWKSRLQIGQTRDKRTDDSNFPGTFNTEQTQAVWFNEFKTDLGFMSAGAEWRGEKISGTTAYDASKRDTFSVFAGYLERLGASQVEFAARHDNEDQFGSRSTGSARVGYALSPGMTGYAIIGRAFSAPSFNDLYYPGANNPALKPERSASVEAGLRTRVGDTRVNIAHFQNRIDDLILFTSKPENLRRAEIKGWELNTETSFAGLAIKSALTVQKPEDRDSGKLLRSRARQFGNVSVNQTIGKWDWSANVFGSSARFDSADEALAKRMGGYALLAANVRYRWNKVWSVDVSAQNLTNRRYELAQGYEPQRRAVFVNVRALAF